MLIKHLKLKSKRKNKREHMLRLQKKLKEKEKKELKELKQFLTTKKIKNQIQKENLLDHLD